jgi:hypothetical protein
LFLNLYKNKQGNQQEKNVMNRIYKLMEIVISSSSRNVIRSDLLLIDAFTSISFISSDVVQMK